MDSGITDNYVRHVDKTTFILDAHEDIVREFVVMVFDWKRFLRYYFGIDLDLIKPRGEI